MRQPLSDFSSLKYHIVIEKGISYLQKMLGNRKGILWFLVVIFSVLGELNVSAQWLAGYAYRKRIDILESQIPGSGTMSNFPVLIDLTDDDLKSCPTGFMENANGWDIRFTSSNG
ncbi:MAG TPA: hypothetical protein VFX73_04375, partial [Chitinophagaceae bacterium]|nr:hypothetical protein [Chitinophagaceae bacterium]